jgi:hypothetical protein
MSDQLGGPAGKRWFHTLVVVGASLTATGGCLSSTGGSGSDAGQASDTASESEADRRVYQDARPDAGAADATGAPDAAVEYPNILIP